MANNHFTDELFKSIHTITKTEIGNSGFSRVVIGTILASDPLTDGSYRIDFEGRQTKGFPLNARKYKQGEIVLLLSTNSGMKSRLYILGASSSLYGGSMVDRQDPADKIDKVEIELIQQGSFIGDLTLSQEEIKERQDAIQEEVDGTKQDLVDTRQELLDKIADAGLGDGESLVEIQEQVDALKGEMSTTITKLENVEGTVSENQTQISQNTEQIALKASSATVNTLTGRVTTAEGAITTLAGLIDLKVSTEVFDKLEGKVESNTAGIKVATDKINSTVSDVTALGDRVTKTETDLEQTAEDFRFNFSSFGTANLLRNGQAKNEDAFWFNGGGGLVVETSLFSGYDKVFKSTLPNGFYGEDVELKNNTHYVFQAMINTANGRTPLDFYCSSTSGTAGKGQCTVIDQEQTPVQGEFVRCHIHFVTAGSGKVFFRPIIGGGSVSAEIRAVEIMLHESRVPTQYSTHSSEVYDGITKIDRNGITVASEAASTITEMSPTGFYLKTNSGTTLLSATARGLVFGAGSITWENLDGDAQENLTGPAGPQGPAGADGKPGTSGTASYVILNGEQVFKYGPNFTGVSTPGEITLTSQAVGIANPIRTWTYKTQGNNVYETITSATSQNLESYVVLPTNTTLFPNDAKTVVIRCAVGAYYDEMTIVKVADGATGKDGTSVNIIGTLNNIGELPMTGNSKGDGYLIDGDLYTWTGTRWENVGKIQGPAGENGNPGAPGQSSFLHIKYSNNGTSFTGNEGEDVGSWIGQYADFVQADSLDFNRYKWKKIEGSQGPAGTPGLPGTDGQSQYFHIRYSQFANGASMTANPVGAIYIGTAVTESSTPPNTASSYSWAKMLGDKGDKGDVGLQGPKGPDGNPTYLHIKYSDNGTSFTANNGETPGKWIGQYVDQTEADSVVFNRYTWKKIEGEQGPAGETAYTVVMTNENHSVITDKNGNPANGELGADGKAVTDVVVYKGSTKLTATTESDSALGGKFKIAIESQLGASAFKGDNDTIYINTMGSDSATVKVNINIEGKQIVTKEMNLTKVKPGSDGAAAKSVFITGEQVFKYPTGASTPTNSSIILTATAQNIMSPTYQWAYKIPGGTLQNITGATSSTYTLTHNASGWSSSNQLILRCTSAGIYDEITVSKLYDGAQGPQGPEGDPGDSGYTVVMSNESHTFPGDSEKAKPSSTESTIIVYKGATQIPVTIGSITGAPTGMTTSIQNNGSTTAKFTVTVTTAMTTQSGMLNIPITIEGKTFSKKFSFSLALAGPLLDWVADWNSNKTQIGGDSLISPKIFSGVRDSGGRLTGVALGRQALGNEDADIGLAGYNNGVKTFSIDKTGKVIIGSQAGKQMIVEANGNIITPNITANSIVGGIIKSQAKISGTQTPLSEMNLDSATLRLGNTAGNAFLNWNGSTLAIKGKMELNSESFVPGGIVGPGFDASNVTVGSLTADRIKAEIIKAINITSETATIGAAKIGKLEAGNISASVISAINISSESATINNAKIGNLHADKITAGDISADRISANVVTAVNMGADKINAGNISTDGLQVGTGNIVDGSILNAKIANGTIENAKIKDATIDHAKIKSVNAGTITVGELDASKITVKNLKADSITTGSITVQGDNLIHNSEFKEPKVWTGIGVIDSSKQYAGYNSLRMDAGGDSYSNFVKASQGETYVISLQSFYETATKPATGTLVILEEYDAESSTRLAWSETELDGTPDVWKNYVKSWTVKNALTKRVRIRITHRAAGKTRIAQPMLSRGSIASLWKPHTDELISDGAITEDKLGDGSVGPEKLILDEIWADEGFIGKFQATEINADKITTGEISSTVLNLKGLVGFEAMDPDISANFKFDVTGNKTYIDGGNIYTNSIKANSLDVRGLTVSTAGNVPTFIVDDGGNVQVSGTLISTNYEEGSDGYKITPDGNIEINEAIIRSGITLPNAGISNYGNVAKNLLRNTEFINNLDGWIEAKHNSDRYTDATLWRLSSPKDQWAYPSEDFNTLVASCKPKSATMSGFEYGPKMYITTEVGKTYTVFWTAAAHRATCNLVVRGTTASGGSWVTSQAFIPKTGGGDPLNWSVYRHTFVAQRTDTSVEFDMISGTTGADTQAAYLWIYQPMVIEGDVPGNVNDAGNLVGYQWQPSLTDATNPVRFWAGTDYKNRDSAPFRVLQDGKIFAKFADLGGTFTGILDIGNIRIQDTNTSSALFRINTNDDMQTAIEMTDTAAVFNTDVNIGSVRYSKANAQLALNTTKTTGGDGDASFALYEKSGGNTTLFKGYNSDGGTHRIKYWKSQPGLIFDSTGSQGNSDFMFERKGGVEDVEVYVRGSLQVKDGIKMASDNKVVMVNRSDAGNSGFDFIVT